MSGKLLPRECAPSVVISTSRRIVDGSVGRVGLEVGRPTKADPSICVSLTAAQAREVARALMEAANKVEPEVAS